MAEEYKAPLQPHEPVLLHEVLSFLQPRQGGLYVDATLGAGGHAWSILAACSPDGQLLGLDVDTWALELARERLSFFGQRAVLLQASYASLKEQLQIVGWKAVDGILLDLGASSMQFDARERGFSFTQDAPLDMRFDLQNPITAAQLVNNLTEKELAELLLRYGEERNAKAIARRIVRARPIATTRQLAELAAAASSQALSKTRKSAAGRSIHPATRTFQALRIAVNHELEALETVLPQAVEALAPGGRLAVISFHSLEDRIVKDFFRRESKDCVCPPRQPVCTCNHRAALREITRHPIRPGDQEIARNPRSRSARLRVAEKTI